MSNLHIVSATGRAYWASYLVNGDGTGLEPDEADEAEAFAAYLAGPDWRAGMFDTKGESFVGRPDYPADAKLGDCVIYRALVPG